MPGNKNLKIAIFPLGPAIGANLDYTYDRCVDFLFQYKSFPFRWMARAYALQALIYDKVFYGFVDKFIQGDIHEDEFIVSMLALLCINIPEQVEARNSLYQAFWDVFMAHHTMIPDKDILCFKETLLNLYPSLPVAVTRATRPCSITTNEKLKPYGIFINEKPKGFSEGNEIQLLCVNKRARELTSAAEDAVSLALGAIQPGYAYTHITVHVLGHFVKAPNYYSLSVQNIIRARLNCESDVRIEPFDVKKGDTFTSACHRAKLVDMPQKNNQHLAARGCAKYGLFAVATSVGAAMSVVSAAVWYNH